MATNIAAEERIVNSSRPRVQTTAAGLFGARWRSLVLVGARWRSLAPAALVGARWRLLVLVGTQVENTLPCESACVA